MPVSELEEDSIKIVIYGQNRVGKTTLACQFPKPLLLVACEPNKTGGAASVKNIQGVTYLRTQSLKSLFQLADELKNTDQFKTVVLDSVTSIQDLVLKEILGLDSLPEMLSWGEVTRDQYRERSEKVREVLRPFSGLETNIVFLGKEKDHNPPDKEKPEPVRGLGIESWFATDLGGATVGWLHDVCDSICRMYVAKETVQKKVIIQGKPKLREQETGKFIRRLLTSYHPNFAAGIRSATPDKVPDYVEGHTPQELFTNLMKVLKG